MEKTNKRIKFGMIISVVAICVSLMVIATSFAEEQTAADSNTSGEATIEENTPIVNKETRFNFNISGYAGEFQCDHYLGGGEEERYIIDISKGIQFQTTDYDHIVVNNWQASLSLNAVDADGVYLEWFDIAPITTNENIGLWISSISGPDANNVINVEYSTFDSFKIEATLYDSSRAPLSGFSLTYYNNYGNPVQTQTTNSDGTATFTFNGKENASGYFYWHDSEGKTGMFTNINANYFPDPENENSSEGHQDVNIYISNNNFVLTGNEHLTNFMFTLRRCNNTDIFSNMTYILPDFICYVPFGNQYYDPTLESSINQDGSFSMNLTIGQSESLIMNFLPIVQPGFEVESWDINDNNYKIGDPVNISLMEFITLVKGTVNFQGEAPGPEPEPPTPQPIAEETGSAQTADETPIAGLILLASIAGLALVINKKYQFITR